MSDAPKTPESGDNTLAPFLLVLRAKLARRLSPADTKVALTASGAKSSFWRGVDAIWHKLVTLSLAGTVLATLAPHASFAAETPVAGAKDARVRTVDYDPDQVVTVIGQFRHAIEIQFGASETVTQAALGDTISWQIAPVGNVVFLKPREKAAGTNLIVLTQEGGMTRTYHFNLALGTSATMYGIRFHYPQAEQAMSAEQAQMAQVQAAQAMQSQIVKTALDHAVIEGKRNFNYTEQGDASLQPSEISDNGEFTAMRFPGHADIPSIFAVDVDGSETIVPYDVRDDFVVIHAVYRELRLRRGKAVLAIYNEAPPRNDRAERTGTVSNIVERKVKGQ
ncbi:TrbG/VirB9 family P-type conjugative transfer protein [Sphingomonas sp. IC081]|uniref:TrbG/VirB9 family P-type conjugative transfer protein n=1 Tax=Sphingomonas sp. IC081 TaxID=304378 RepID=UPI00115AD809|nr:TrbG/VirB9 family P-type conjugative transfer protein [Sphingomonas sp. IC081]QDK36004.1 conjugal transfer protein [Sphingomonas sp. IC081]